MNKQKIGSLFKCLDFSQQKPKMEKTVLSSGKKERKKKKENKWCTTISEQNFSRQLKKHANRKGKTASGLKHQLKETERERQGVGAVLLTFLVSLSSPSFLSRSTMTFVFSPPALYFVMKANSPCLVFITYWNRSITQHDVRHWAFICSGHHSRRRWRVAVMH